MKEKIKNALKTNYANLGLGDKAFDGVASFLAKTITKEEEIDGVIKGEDTKSLLKAFQGESDSLRNRASQLEKDFNAYKEAHPDKANEPSNDPPAGGKKDDEEPAWAKKLREQNEKILERQAADDAARALKENLSAVESKLKGIGCTNPGILKGVLKGFALSKDETIDQAAERLKGEYDASYKETFGAGPVPPVGVPAFGDAKTAVDKKNEFLRQQGLLPNKE